MLKTEVIIKNTLRIKKLFCELRKDENLWLTITTIFFVLTSNNLCY